MAKPMVRRAAETDEVESGLLCDSDDPSVAASALKTRRDAEEGAGARFTGTAALLPVMLGTVAFVVACATLFSSNWVVGDETVGFKNHGEEHEVRLRMGLAQIAYTHVTRKRFNVVSKTAFDAPLSVLCSTTEATSEESHYGFELQADACDAVHAAAALARAACIGIFVVLLSLVTEVFFARGGRLLTACSVAVSLLAVGAALGAWRRASAARETCVVIDVETSAKLVGDSNVAELICARIATGSAPVALFCAACAAVAVAVAPRARAWSRRVWR